MRFYGLFILLVRSLAKNLANAIFGYCDCFQVPKVTLGKNPMYIELKWFFRINNELWNLELDNFAQLFHLLLSGHWFVFCQISAELFYQSKCYSFPWQETFEHVKTQYFPSFFYFSGQHFVTPQIHYTAIENANIAFHKVENNIFMHSNISFKHWNYVDIVPQSNVVSLEKSVHVCLVLDFFQNSTFSTFKI